MADAIATTPTNTRRRASTPAEKSVEETSARVVHIARDVVHNARDDDATGVMPRGAGVVIGADGSPATTTIINRERLDESLGGFALVGLTELTRMLPALSGSAVRCLLAIMVVEGQRRKMSPMLALRRKDLGKAMGTSAASLSRPLAELEEAGAFVVLGNDGVFPFVFLNPRLMWRGKSSAANRNLKVWDALLQGKAEGWPVPPRTVIDRAGGQYEQTRAERRGRAQERARDEAAAKAQALAHRAAEIAPELTALPAIPYDESNVLRAQKERAEFAAAFAQVARRRRSRAAFRMLTDADCPDFEDELAAREWIPPVAAVTAAEDATMRERGTGPYAPGGRWSDELDSVSAVPTSLRPTALAFDEDAPDPVVLDHVIALFGRAG